MTFKIKNLDAKNFMSYETLNLDIADPKGCYLIRSSNSGGDGTEGSTSNGEGKSSILEAISYALYGKTIRGTKHFVQRDKKWCEVRLIIESKASSEIIEIHRTKNHPEYKTTLTVTLNGEMVTDDLTNTKSQSIINARLGDFSAFLFRSVSPEIANFMALGPSVKVQTLLDYFGLDFEKMYRRASEGYQKANDELANEQRTHAKINREMIELGARISASKEYEENIAATKKQLNTKLAALKNKQISIETELEEHEEPAILTQQAKEATEKKEAAQKKKTEAQSAISTLEAKLRQIKTSLNTDKIYTAATLCGLNIAEEDATEAATISALRNEINSLTQQKDRLQKNVESEALALLNLVPQNLLEEHVTLAYTKRAKNLQSTKEEAGTHRSEAEATKKLALKTAKKCEDAALNPQCPTCFQPINAIMLQKLTVKAQDEITQADTTITERTAEITQANESIQALITRFKNHVLKVLDEKIQKLLTEEKQKKENLAEKVAQANALLKIGIQNILDISTKKIKELEATAATTEEDIAKAEQEAASANMEYQKVRDLKNETKSISEQEKSLLEQIQTLQSKTEEIEKQIAHFATLEQQIKIAETTVAKVQQTVDVWDTWKEQLGASGIRNLCLKDILAMLNERVNYYLAQLFRTQEVRLHFVLTDSGNIDIETTVLEYENASNGERKRINISVVLAMADIKSAGATNMGFRFFDEVMDSLDQAGTSAVLNIFSGLASEQIFIVSHNPFFEREMLQRSAHLHIVQVQKTEAGSTANIAA